MSSKLDREDIEKLRLLASVTVNASDAIVITEVEPITELGPKIIYVNKAFELMTGYTASEVIGKTPRILQGPKTDRAELDKIRAALLKREPIRSDLINYSKDGSERWIELEIVPVANENGIYTHFISIQRDITARKKIEAELQKFFALVDRSSDFIAMCSMEGKTLFVNEAGRKLVGLNTLEEAVSKKLSDYLPEEDVASFYQSILPKVIDEGRTLSEAKLRHFKTGETIDVERSCFIVRHPENQDILCLATVQRDITERKKAQAAQLRAQVAEEINKQLEKEISERKKVERKLRYSNLHDNLTGLANRVLFMDRLKQAIFKLKRHQDKLIAVLFLDLDRFKVINDSLGHYCGDRLLIEFARRLTKCLRSIDTVARLGGDEFSILLEDLKDSSDATTIARRINEEMRLSFNLCGQEVFTSASIGIAFASSEFDSPENLLRNADIAMYRAKERGKGRHAVFNSKMHDRAVDLLQMENDLKWALERSEFCLYYQPIVSLETRKIMGFEALIRWQHPERGLVSPAEFIPLAEETGLILPIGFWVIQEACYQMRIWQQQSQSNRKLSVSVNISGKQFAQTDFVEQVGQILQETNLEPNCLRLEITESILLEEIELATSMLLRLKELGVKIYLDDFGTGFSSLSCLHRLPITELKIDRSFIKSMEVEVEGLEIVRAIVVMAHNLGIDVIAEGVETQQQLQKLRNLNCAYAQGYLFSPPVNRDAAYDISSDRGAESKFY